MHQYSPISISNVLLLCVTLDRGSAVWSEFYSVFILHVYGNGSPDSANALQKNGCHWATHENSHIYLFSYYSHHCIKNWRFKDNILSIKWTWHQSNAMIPSNVCVRSTEILLFILLHSKAIWHSCHKIFVDS